MSRKHLPLSEVIKISEFLKTILVPDEAGLNNYIRNPSTGRYWCDRELAIRFGTSQATIRNIRVRLFGPAYNALEDRKPKQERLVFDGPDSDAVAELKALVEAQSAKLDKALEILSKLM